MLCHPIYATDYKVDKEYIKANFDFIPKKGESHKDELTGLSITRLTDASELVGTKDALIVYSRYSPENSNQKFVIIFGSNSTSSWIVNRKTQEVLTELTDAKDKSIGEKNEIRWDGSGKYPNRVYYRSNMALYQIDDILNKDQTTSLIYDFSKHSRVSTRIYNDVEGDSSNDSDHWAFMAAHYNGKTQVLDAFIHYQISTGIINILKPSDLAGTDLNHYANKKNIPRPNMVEISPNGTGMIIHYNKAWGNEVYGNRPKDKNTWFDGPHLWPLNLNHKDQEPIKVAISSTHSGWAFNENNEELFISQNNSSDKFDAVKITGSNSGYKNKYEFFSHSDIGWSNGFHFGKMNSLKSNWVFVSTYSNTKSKNFNTSWGEDQLVMLRLSTNPLQSNVWRIIPTYNKYSGHYRDEAAAAINFTGNRVYLTSNWGGKLDHREVFSIDLPETWHSDLD
ncbi:MAG: hypothetical protein COA78_29910 [Blastopirellula sp.]|nr:MAG: hypothetical protein COA78_29910 [Blastopirellula sp.]